MTTTDVLSVLRVWPDCIYDNHCCVTSLVREVKTWMMRFTVVQDSTYSKVIKSNDYIIISISYLGNSKTDV